ncbi:hypothetical protein GUJ93_ZPchr0009g955 [Zizania palustris]|uniref:ZF-HD dimerization-type domain-containing protein n=1 Tax=Zizania palustris TaxID=103762 RepID=A0A8J5RL39_ZIZPA|nr:hypothetical protein GUJ93_ZPchr0009g955 [Zizania palustris]
MHAAASPYVGLHHVHHHHNGGAGANGRHMSPPKPPATAMAEAATEENKKGGRAGGERCEVPGVPQEPCGGHRRQRTDGCGEFMPAGEEGSLDALRCSACGCHRNFHRKELDYPAGGAWETGTRPPHHTTTPDRRGSGSPSPLASHRGHLLVAALPPPTRMVMPLSTMHDGVRRRRTLGAAEAVPYQVHGGAEGAHAGLRRGGRLAAAEAGGHRRAAFCQEVGVKRRVLKVWMHNNKHTLASRHQPPPQPEPGGPIPSSPQLRLE